MTAPEKLLAAHTRLCDEYHCPIGYFATLDPLSELVSSLLSHRTKNADSARAYRALRAKYETWEAVRDAPTDDVQTLIAHCTWPEQKAPQLQAVLRRLTETVGEPLSLDCLAEMDADAARAFLQTLPGVGPKTAAATLSFFTLRGKALPVDSHHHRVAIRLGVIGANVAVGASHALLEAMLPPDWDAQTVYDHHEVLMLHGQQVCFYQAPRCEKCVVRDLCDYYAAKHTTERTSPAKPA